MKLKELRLNGGMTQKQIADLLGVSQTVYNRYEKEAREPSKEMLIALANIYGITVDELIGHVEPDTKKEPAVSGRLDDQFSSRIALLSPENKARMEAYLDGLLAAQDAQVP